MNLIINDNGDKIPYKSVKKFNYGIIEIDTDFGKNFHVLFINELSELTTLFQKNKKEAIKFYFYNDILYIAIEGLSNYYMADEFTPEFINQIKNNNQIIIGLGNDYIEDLILFDKII